MDRYELRQDDLGWAVFNRHTGITVANGAGIKTKLEAQALVDFRNGLSRPVDERVRSRLQMIKIAWKAIVADP